MTIRAITEILQYAISKRRVKHFRRKYQKNPKFSNGNNAFFSLHKVDIHSKIRACRAILQSYISGKYVKYFRRNREITLNVLM
jgi:hypothetical protein